MAKQASKQPIWRNRVKELRYVVPSALADHPLQWRLHPEQQRGALEGVLREIGIAGALLAYDSPVTGLTSIDGHLRKSLGETPWPTLILDVTDEEAALLLATHDPLSTMAETDTQALTSLLASVSSGEDAVSLLLHDLAAISGIGGEIGDDQTETGMQALVKHSQPVKIALAIADVQTVEQALHATGIDNRGVALVTVCQTYLEGQA